MKSIKKCRLWTSVRTYVELYESSTLRGDADWRRKSLKKLPIEKEQQTDYRKYSTSYPSWGS